MKKTNTLAKAGVLAVGLTASGVAAGDMSGFNPLDASQAFADAKVTSCAAPGQILDQKNGEQCVTIITSLRRGQTALQAWPGYRVSQHIDDRKVTASQTQAVDDAASFMHTFGNTWHTSIRSENVVYTNIEMSGCTGSWRGRCYTEEIGNRPSGYEENNATHRASQAWEWVTGREIVIGRNTTPNTPIQRREAPACGTTPAPSNC